ncbi:E3 ubiquitin-protein ligase UPL3 [Camellia lanceoleosa]|uniref:E3 ubiquitin-protein ligase UPL3 n=1 Tax=Camellia lanceoleosa TaxID=1840588 RepID=A0ACC0J296_9ERIC|nr:E3 ubiquitin-protein ligase UPL3 [Camellia lanceoleosa]
MFTVWENPCLIDSKSSLWSSIPSPSSLYIEVFGISTLQIFSSHELDYLFCCRRESWEILTNEIHYVKPVATEAVQLTAKAHYSGKSKEEVTAVNIPRIFVNKRRTWTHYPF